MKKLGLILILLVFVFTWANVFADDDTAATVQQGFGILGGILNRASESKDSKQQAEQQVEQQNTQTTASSDDMAQEEEFKKLVAQKDAELVGFWAKEQPVLNQKIAQNKVLKIKGLYIGMNIDDACKVLNEKLEDKAEVSPIVLPNENNVLVLNGYTVNCLSTDAGYPEMVPVLVADAYKRVVTIQLTPMIVDFLYNTAGINGEEFAQKFVDSYKIAKMSPFVKDGIQGWTYASPEGYKISVTVNKIILLEKVASESEMKFD